MAKKKKNKIRDPIGLIISNLNKDRRTNVATSYSHKGRYIDKATYIRLKRQKRCSRCHKTTNGKLQIHHKKALRDGGTNDPENLIAVCKPCHDELDKKQQP